MITEQEIIEILNKLIKVDRCNDIAWRIIGKTAAAKAIIDKIKEEELKLLRG